MMQENFNQTDLLDTLRYLNSKNINDSKELKDVFFDSLMQSETTIPEDVMNAAKLWKERAYTYNTGIDREYEINKDYIYDVAPQIQESNIDDRIGSLYIDCSDKNEIFTYIAGILGEKEFVETTPEAFDLFKENLLLGLFVKQYNYLGTEKENRERMEKIVNMSVEQYLQIHHGLEYTEELKSYIDDEFLEEIEAYKKQLGKLDIHGITQIFGRLIVRNRWEFLEPGKTRK